jgi:hypothetical protein
VGRFGGCRLRLFGSTVDARLLAIEGFAKKVVVELWRGIEIRDFGDYEATSALTVVGDLEIVGLAIGDGANQECLICLLC